MLRKVGCSMVLVDEVHRLDLRIRKGAAASDELKYLFDSVSATFVYAGLDLAENGMFTGTRGRQLASSRRLAQILARSGDRAWAWKEFIRAWELTRRQPEYAMKYMPAQERRWCARAAAFGIPVFTGSGTTTIASAIVAFPEAVALAAIITDLSLRRHAALNWDARPLYQRIGASLGESPRLGWTHNDPAHRWAHAHYDRFDHIRRESWDRLLPPPERFK